LREYPGVSILIYEQTCATEKRRRRKRGKLADPARRVFINEAVCEGCGDCGVQSNCLAVAPLETEFGRKREIDQSACNKDFSCLKGFCPSFVTIEGGSLKKGRILAVDESLFSNLPEPMLPDTRRPFNILITGVGGTGVVTLGALVGMAAHIDGKGVSVLDMTGLAQKYGAVFSHLRIADQPADIHAARIATGEAHAIVGGDLVVSAGTEAVSKMLGGKTRAVVNTAETPTAEFTRNPDWQFPLSRMEQRIVESCGEGSAWFFDAQHLSIRLMGDAIFANTLLLGAAWQRGMIPVSLAAIEKAFELNGTAVEKNKQAFLWGRRSAHQPEAVDKAATPAQVLPLQRFSRTLGEIVSRRAAELTAYQDSAYAERYRTLIARVESAEAPLGSTAVAEAVARNYFRLLAIKDEYEVARLYTDPAFMARIRENFEGDFQLQFHLAPPLLAKHDPDSGRPLKQAYGPWMMRAFGVLAKLKGLRGTALDIFGKTEERRMERQLISDYEADVALILQGLQPDSLSTALALAKLPEQIRGFGHVKAASVAVAAVERKTLRAAMQAGSVRVAA
ncbi:MAG: indolepyruvate ferredoxin oxidoreductase, partial [Pseudomonadota bacterium]|nr:indolepyruvate ferredoxin oxidoreductase [Pseudomonadota bacterium]